MGGRRFGVSVWTLAVLIFSLLKNGLSDGQLENLLQLLSQANVKPPYIAILSPQARNVEENIVPDGDLNEDITPEIDSLEPPHDQKAYLLYHALMTTEEKEQIDPEAERLFKQTKDVLRQALRKRCNQLKSCYRTCPKKLNIKCTVECKETHDDYDVCQQKKKCKKPKCGKTLPPTW